jgi:peptidyl-prolyl cis-trans isomerase D
MITWMQRHKKWLIVTIWVSAIAFIGAGFVGWGSYDYSKTNGTIAKVGDREISVKDVQNEYSALYMQYKSVYGERFNDELAKKLNLEQIAFQKSIQNAQVLSFADELGLIVTDQEVAQALVETPQFSKDGKFDKETYVKVLSQNRLNPVDYENDIKKSLLLTKTASIFQAQANKNEVELLNALLNLEDDLEIYVVDGESLTINPSEDELKSYWKTNKDKYKSKIKYLLETYEVVLSDTTFSEDEISNFYNDNKTLFRDEEGKILALDKAKDRVIEELRFKKSKKDALRKYIDLKKSRLAFSQKVSYEQDRLPFDAESIAKIKSAQAGTVLKPFKLQNSYVIVKVNDKLLPQTLSYDAAKELVLKDFIQEKKIKEVQTLADQKLNQLGLNALEMTPVGFVSRDSVDQFKTIDTVNETEAMEFLNAVFNTTESASGIVTLQYSKTPKAIVYRIKSQRLGTINEDENTQRMISNGINEIKNNLVFTNLVKKLEYRYETQTFMKGNN